MSEAIVVWNEVHTPRFLDHISRK